MLKLGARPPVLSKPRLKLGPRLFSKAPDAPLTADWLSMVNDWPMYGNDVYGDCVFAAIAHQIEALTTYGRGTTAMVEEKEVLRGYSDVTGFDPADPQSDQGTIVQDALNYWRKTGIGRHKIVAFAEIDITDEEEMNAAMAVFGSLHIAINFPASAMDQFDAGQPWDVVRRDGGNQGGHAIHLGQYEPGGLRTVITWGQEQKMTEAFWQRYGSEAWAVISEEWVSAAGITPTGLDLHGLGEDFAALTGQHNPWPLSPDPEPSDIDSEFIKAAETWLSYRHTSKVNAAMVKATKAWLAADWADWVE